jgi:intein/homing endonuclease
MARRAVEIEEIQAEEHREPRRVTAIKNNPRNPKIPLTQDGETL